MRLCLFACLAVCGLSQEWAPFDPLNAHGGIFRALPWTEFEMAKISSMHSTADYHNLMALITEKLVEHSDKIDPEARKKIEQFLVKKRPPSVLKHMLSDDERENIRHHHLSGEIDRVLRIIQGGLDKLADKQRETVLQYLGLGGTQE